MDFVDSEALMNGLCGMLFASLRFNMLTYNEILLGIVAGLNGLHRVRVSF